MKTFLILLSWSVESIQALTDTVYTHFLLLDSLLIDVGILLRSYGEKKREKKKKAISQTRRRLARL